MKNNTHRNVLLSFGLLSGALTAEAFAQSVGALAAILQAHNREINQLRSIDPVRVIHINNLVKYRKQIEGLL